MTDAIDLPALIDDCPLFAPLAADERTALEELFERREVAEGDVLVDAGAPARALYLVQAGTLGLLVEGDVVAGMSGGGFYVELAPLLAGGASAMTVRGMEPSVVWEASFEALEAWLAERPATGVAFYREVARAVAARLLPIYEDPDYLRSLLE